MKAEYERHPIRLAHNCIATINIYNREACLEDFWTSELDDIIEHVEKKYPDDMFKRAAKQFIEQLEGNWCVSFMEALKKEINNELKKHKECIKNENKSTKG